MDEKKNCLRQFYKKHPKFRRILDIIGMVCSAINRVSWILLAAIIIGGVLYTFFKLPESINKPVSIVVGGILTAFAFPSYIEHKRIQHDSRLIILQKCAGFHEETVTDLMALLKTRNQNEQRETALKIANRISEYYPIISMYFTRKQIEIMYSLKDECAMICKHKKDATASMDTLLYIAHKYLNDIRRQSYSTGKANLRDSLGRKIELPPEKKRAEIASPANK